MPDAAPRPPAYPAHDRSVAAAHLVIQRRRFVLDAAFTLDAGERLAVIGPNGAGKSTLLAALAGHLRLADGQFILDGRTLDDGPRRHVPPYDRDIVLLGQNPLIFPHLTVRRNIEYGPRAHGLPRQEVRRIAAGLIKRLGLAELADAPGHTLSGGQQQRVALARSLAVRPALLLLDEPFAALDVDSAARLRAVTRDVLDERGTPAVVVSHELLDVTALATRAIVLEAGRVVDEGPTGRVLEAPRSAFAAAMSGIGVVDCGDGAPRDWLPDTINQAAARVFIPPDAVTLTPNGTTEVIAVAAAPTGVAVTVAGSDRLVVLASWAIEPWLTPGTHVNIRIDTTKIRAEQTKSTEVA